MGDPRSPNCLGISRAYLPPQRKNACLGCDTSGVYLRRLYVVLCSPIDGEVFSFLYSPQDYFLLDTVQRFTEPISDFTKIKQMEKPILDCINDWKTTTSSMFCQRSFDNEELPFNPSFWDQPIFIDITLKVSYIYPPYHFSYPFFKLKQSKSIFEFQYIPIFLLFIFFFLHFFFFNLSKTLTNFS